MDQTEKNRRKKRINELVGVELAVLGFPKTKPYWFVRQHQNIAEFMHLHFYKATNDIRVHLGWRVFNDPFPALALNGPHFDSGARNPHTNPETGRRYDFGYNIIGHKEDEAIREIVVFFREVAFPFFERVKKDEWAMLPDPLKKLIRSQPRVEAFEASRALLKIK